MRDGDLAERRLWILALAASGVRNLRPLARGQTPRALTRARGARRSSISRAMATKKNGGPAVKRVIDAKATEVPLDGAGDGDASDDEPEAAAGTPGTGAARNRPLGIVRSTLLRR
jgi:hypothetical protein